MLSDDKQIIYAKQALKVIQRMDSMTKQRIKKAIENLPSGDVKQLKGNSISTNRLRVGSWRILYSCDDKNIIRVEKISPRGEVYKGV